MGPNPTFASSVETAAPLAAPLKNSTVSALDLVRQFWDAPMEALFRPPVIALVLCKTQAWAERKRTVGGGPRFIRIGRRSVVYRKSDVLEWLNSQQQVGSTSEYDGVAA